MATLKSTLKIESTDLFPTPVSFTKVNNNTVGAAYSTFSSVTVGTALVTLSLVVPSADAYVYLSAPATNTGNIVVGNGGVTVGTGFVTLAPGDVAFFPYGDGAAATVALEAIATAAAQSLEFFIGNK
jgi:hypothetical protein